MGNGIYFKIAGWVDLDRVPIKCETKRNQRKRNETKSTKTKRNEINERKRNQRKQNEESGRKKIKDKTK